MRSSRDEHVGHFWLNIELIHVASPAQSTRIDINSTLFGQPNQFGDLSDCRKTACRVVDLFRFLKLS